MEGRAGEALLSRDGRERRAVELPDRADDPVERPRSSRCRRPARTVSDHSRAVVVEAGLGHLAPEADALPQLEVLGRRLEVGQQVGLGREAGDPVVGLGEGEAVELVGDVDAAARVHVLEPGAAHVAVLLEHRDRHTGLAQPVCRRQPRGAGPDDGAAERRRRRRSVRHEGSPRVGAFERELLGQEALPVLGRAGSRPGTRRCCRRSSGVSAMVGPARGQVVRQRGGGQPHAPLPPASGPRPRPGTSSCSWSGANSSRSSDRSPVRCATAQSSGCTSAAAQAACRPLVVARRPGRPHPCGRAYAGASRPGGQRPMCLPSSAIWLLTSTVRGSLSMAVARLSAVQRSSVSTESAIDHPA